MALSVLNNIPSLVAQNQLEVTNNNLQNTLFQLSSGSRINSGADDPAGLSIINGLQANISALQQSSQNATDGVGQLQVADGALSQVTTLLNRAVTLATEAANGGLTSDQFAAVTNEYASITSEINRIGQATNFNGTSVFSAATMANPNQVVSSAAQNVNVNEALTNGTTTTVQLGNGQAYTYSAGASATTLLGGADLNTEPSPEPTGANAVIANGATITIANSGAGGGTVNFTAAPMTYTGTVGIPLTDQTATAGGEGLTVVDTLGRTTGFTAVAGADTVGDWIAGFNADAIANNTGASAALDAQGQLQITSDAGIASVTPDGNGDFAAMFGPMTNQPLNYMGTTATTGTTAVGASNTLWVTNEAGLTFKFTNGSSTPNVTSWIQAFNTAAASSDLKASLTNGGVLQITSTNPTATGGLTISNQSASNIAAFGTMTGASDTVGDLMNQINTSGKGMTASINANGQFQVTSSTGAITVSNNSMNSTLGTVAATNTVQDLINGIDKSGLGVTASIVPQVQNPNELVGSGVMTSGASTAIAAGNTLTLNSGVQSANGTYANTYTYTAGDGSGTQIPDTVAGTPNNGTVQGLIDAINNSGTPFHAFLDANDQLHITDSSYSGNLVVGGTETGVAGPTGTGTFSKQAPTDQLEITDPQNRGDLTVTNTDPLLGYVAPTNGNPLEGTRADSFVAPSMSGNGGASVFISDGEVTNPLYNTITIQVGLLSSTQIGTNATSLLSQNLGTATGASAALTVINGAISDVAAMRGTIGAGINRLNSATNVINTQVQNLTSAQSSMQDANIGQVVANMSKYQVLEQTGISALAQANQNEQAVLKLLQ